MTASQQVEFQEMGYSHIIKNAAGICGIARFLFTTGLIVGIDEFGYNGRYCYPCHRDAIEAVLQWDGIGDPPGDWIKYKGEGGERRNPKLITQFI